MVGRATFKNLGDRRGGGDCLTTPTTCPGEEEHVLQLREAAATQRTRLVYTRTDETGFLYSPWRGVESVGAYRLPRSPTKMSALETSLLEPSIRLDDPLLSSELFLLLFLSCFDFHAAAREIARSWKLEQLFDRVFEFIWYCKKYALMIILTFSILCRYQKLALISISDFPRRENVLRK